MTKNEQEKLDAEYERVQQLLFEHTIDYFLPKWMHRIPDSIKLLAIWILIISVLLMILHQLCTCC